MPKLDWMQSFALQLDKSIKESQNTLLEMFQIIDTNNNNEIDLQEFKQLFKMIDMQKTDPEIISFFEKMDI